MKVLLLSPQDKLNAFTPYLLCSCTCNGDLQLSVCLSIVLPAQNVLRLILWEIFFDANIRAWINSGCE